MLSSCGVARPSCVPGRVPWAPGAYLSPRSGFPIHLPRLPASSLIDLGRGLIRPAAHERRHCVKGDLMDCQTEVLLAKLQEKVRLRHQDASAGRSSSQSLTPQIKMIVGDWYVWQLVHSVAPPVRDAREFELCHSVPLEIQLTQQIVYALVGWECALRQKSHGPEKTKCW